MRRALILAALLSLSAQAQDILPDRIAVMGWSWHTSKTRHLNDFTPGLMLSWDAPQLPWERGSLDVAIFRNSQGFPGLYAGLSKEWRLSPRWYVGLGAGATYGYRRYEHDVQMAGTVNHGVRFGCIPDLLCVYEVPGKPRWQPAALLSARVQLDHGFYLAATYLPAGTIAKWVNGNNGFLRNADAISLWAGMEF